MSKKNNFYKYLTTASAIAVLANGGSAFGAIKYNVVVNRTLTNMDGGNTALVNGDIINFQANVNVTMDAAKTFSVNAENAAVAANLITDSAAAQTITGITKDGGGRVNLNFADNSVITFDGAAKSNFGLAVGYDGLSTVNFNDANGKLILGWANGEIKAEMVASVDGHGKIEFTQSGTISGKVGANLNKIGSITVADGKVGKVTNAELWAKEIKIGNAAAAEFEFGHNGGAFTIDANTNAITFGDADSVLRIVNDSGSTGNTVITLVGDVGAGADEAIIELTAKENARKIIIENGGGGAIGNAARIRLLKANAGSGESQINVAVSAQNIEVANNAILEITKQVIVGNAGNGNITIADNGTFAYGSDINLTVNKNNNTVVVFGGDNAKLKLQNTGAAGKTVTLHANVNPGADGKGIIEFHSTTNKLMTAGDNGAKTLGANGSALKEIQITGAGIVEFGHGKTYAKNIKIDNGANLHVENHAANYEIIGDINGANTNQGNLKFLGAGKVTGNIGKAHSLQLVEVGLDAVAVTGDLSAEKILYNNANALTVGGHVTGDVDFNNKAGTFTLADNKTITGTVDSTGGPNGTLVFAGNGEVTGAINSLNAVTFFSGGGANQVVTLSRDAGAATFTFANAGAVTANGNITGDIDFNNTAGTFTLADTKKIDGAVNSLGGASGTLEFAGTGQVRGVIGANNLLTAVKFNGVNSTVTLGNNAKAANFKFYGDSTVILADGKIITGAVDADTSKKGTLKFAGTGTMAGAGTIGDAVGLTAVEFNGNNTTIVTFTANSKADTFKFTDDTDDGATLALDANAGAFVVTGNILNGTVGPVDNVGKINISNDNVNINGNIGTNTASLNKLTVATAHTATITGTDYYVTETKLAANGAAIVFINQKNMKTKILGDNANGIVTFNNVKTEAVEFDINANKVANINIEGGSVLTFADPTKLVADGVINIGNATTVGALILGSGTDFTIMTINTSKLIFANASSNLTLKNTHENDNVKVTLATDLAAFGGGGGGGILELNPVKQERKLKLDGAQTIGSNAAALKQVIVSGDGIVEHDITGIYTKELTLEDKATLQVNDAKILKANTTNVTGADFTLAVAGNVLDLGVIKVEGKAKFTVKAQGGNATLNYTKFDLLAGAKEVTFTNDSDDRTITLTANVLGTKDGAGKIVVESSERNKTLTLANPNHFGGAAKRLESFTFQGVGKHHAQADIFAKKVTVQSLDAKWSNIKLGKGGTLQFLSNATTNGEITGENTTIDLGKNKITHEGGQAIFLGTTTIKTTSNNSNGFGKIEFTADKAQFNANNVTLEVSGTIAEPMKNQTYRIVSGATGLEGASLTDSAKDNEGKEKLTSLNIDLSFIELDVLKASGGNDTTKPNNTGDKSLEVIKPTAKDGTIYTFMDTTVNNITGKKETTLYLETIKKDFGGNIALSSAIVGDSDTKTMTIEEGKNFANTPAGELLAILNIMPTDEGKKKVLAQITQAAPTVDATALSSAPTVISNVASNLAGANIEVRMDNLGGGSSSAVKVSEAEGLGVAAGSAEDANRYGVWGMPFYGQGTQSKQGEIAGFTNKAKGATIGFDTLINDSLTLGIAGTYVDTDVKFKHVKAGDKMKAKTKIASIYAMQALENNLFTQGVLSYGQSNINVKNQRNTGKTTVGLAAGKFKSKIWSGEALLGYNHAIADTNCVLTPTIGMRYTKINDGGYKENGPMAVTISKKATTKVEGILGGRVSWAINSGEMMIVPEVHGTINHDFKGKAPKFEMRLDGGLKPLPTANGKAVKTVYNAGTSIMIKNGMIETGVGYDATMYKKYTGHQGSAKLRINF